MRPTRKTQPHRRSGSREPSPVLDAMRRGRGAYQPPKRRRRKPGALSRRVAALSRVPRRSRGT